MMLEIALGPMLWILFGASLVATSISILVAALKRAWPAAIGSAAVPFLIASAGARLELYYLDATMAEEGGGLAAVAPSIARALMLSMLGSAATLAPANPAAMSVQKGDP